MSVAPARRRLTWVGHATVLLELARVQMLTDPLLRGRVAHLRRHAPTPDIGGTVDAVLISHVHHDHLDRPSLRRLAGPATVAVVPVGAAKLLRGLPFGTVHEVRAGEVVVVGEVEVQVVPAWHRARRRPGAQVLDALGFLVDGVWFAGDTGLHDDLTALRGRVAIALLPIWGWGTSVGPGHLDPASASRALAMVRPEMVVPIHWGTLLPFGLRRRHRDLLHTPADEFAACAARMAPDVLVRRLDVGGTLEA
jgi:L-ascorbate metabolism protein UlaG (beta-lactamase superfamily)